MPPANHQVRSPAFSILQKNSMVFFARPSRAHARCAGPEWSKHRFPKKNCVKMSGAFSRPSGGRRGFTPPNLRFSKKSRNVVSVGTFLRPKLQLRIGEHLRTSEQTMIKSPEKSCNLQKKMYQIPFITYLGTIPLRTS